MTVLDCCTSAAFFASSISSSRIGEQSWRASGVHEYDLILGSQESGGGEHRGLARPLPCRYRPDRAGFPRCVQTECSNSRPPDVADAIALADVVVADINVRNRDAMRQAQSTAVALPTSARSFGVSHGQQLGTKVEPDQAT